jgi:hypothetical protein
VDAHRGLARTRSVIERLRFVLLVAVGSLLAHDSIFAAQYGLGRARDDALAATAHSYWPAFTALTLLVAAVGAGWAVAGLARLSRLLRGFPAVAASPGGYGREVLRLWPRLFITVTLVFLVQENVEHVASGQAAPGLFALSAPGYPLAIPVLVVVCGLLAAVGGWLRRHHEILVLRLRAARMQWRRATGRITATAQRWRLVAALVAHGRILTRTDAGRAPPAPLRA